MYIYPDNLKSKASMWLWELKDLAVTGIIVLISVFAFAYAKLWFPMVIAGVYAFLTIQVEDTTILKFIRYACAYFWWNNSIMNGGIPQMKRKNEQSTRELMGTKELSDYSIRTYRKDELVYFLIQPSNLSVLSEESLSARIYGLMTVLKGITEIEMMCLNSRENFEDNKRYLKNRAEEETNPTVRKLLELDAGHLDRMQVQMATAREFLLIIRLRNQKENEVFAYLNRIEKMLVEQGFTSKRADEEDMKRILAVYFEQNVTTEKFEEFDGERWIILNE